MRMAVIAGVAGAVLPTLALAQVKVVLGDGVSVVFPSAPAKMHMTTEPPPAGSTGAGMGFLQAVQSTDMWTLRIGGAMFEATAMSPRKPPGAPSPKCDGPPMPVAPGTFSLCDSRDLASPAEHRRLSENGTLFVSRSVQFKGRIYGVIFMRSGESQLAKVDPAHETPPDSAGEAFINSFKVAAQAAN